MYYIKTTVKFGISIPIRCEEKLLEFANQILIKQEVENRKYIISVLMVRRTQRNGKGSIYTIISYMEISSMKLVFIVICLQTLAP